MKFALGFFKKVGGNSVSPFLLLGFCKAEGRNHNRNPQNAGTGETKAIGQHVPGSFIPATRGPSNRSRLPLILLVCLFFPFFLFFKKCLLLSCSTSLFLFYSSLKVAHFLNWHCIFRSMLISASLSFSIFTCAIRKLAVVTHVPLLSYQAHYTLCMCTRLIIDLLSVQYLDRMTHTNDHGDDFYFSLPVTLFWFEFIGAVGLEMWSDAKYRGPIKNVQKRVENKQGKRNRNRTLDGRERERKRL
jgi:hypothetical protein